MLWLADTDCYFAVIGPYNIPYSLAAAAKKIDLCIFLTLFKWVILLVIVMYVILVQCGWTTVNGQLPLLSY